MQNTIKMIVRDLDASKAKKKEYELLLDEAELKGHSAMRLHYTKIISEYVGKIDAYSTALKYCRDDWNSSAYA